MSIERIGIVGSGTIGTSVAIDFALKGFEVCVLDLPNKSLVEFKANCLDHWRAVKLARHAALPNLDPDIWLTQISFTHSYDDLGDVDLVIENVEEILDSKREVYHRLIQVCREDVIYAANTSCIPIKAIRSFLPPDTQLIGMHFMNPAPLKKLVEVVKDEHVSLSLIEKVTQTLQLMGKEPVVVHDNPGFVMNRVLMLMINECSAIVEAKIATPRDVDKIFRLGTEHRQGPLSTADLIGVDTVVNSLKVLWNETRLSRFIPNNVMSQMVIEGKLGRKAGEGFFKYR